MFDWLIVGAGFAGSVMAERLASQAGERVLIVDKRPHIGGNAYDYFDRAGILIHKYGPHIFHTNDALVFEYLSRFTEWRPYRHRVLTSVGGELQPVTVERDVVTQLQAIGGGAAALSESVPEDDPQVARLPREGLYFSDRFQVMPAQGYTRLFEAMLGHPDIKIMLNTDFEEIRDVVPFRRLIYTGSIDEYFGYCYGKLPYQSARLDHLVLDEAEHQAAPVLVYPEGTGYTRIAEYKQLTGQHHPRTSLTIERTAPEGEPCYPTAEGRALYGRYKELAEATPDVFFIGRLATYRYCNMDEAVAQALATYGRIADGDADGRMTAFPVGAAGRPELR